jgi:hypothetical protein
MHVLFLPGYICQKNKAIIVPSPAIACYQVNNAVRPPPEMGKRDNMSGRAGQNVRQTRLPGRNRELIWDGGFLPPAPGSI